jgi:transitional endoplasmic reticulum ATPase
LFVTLREGAVSDFDVDSVVFLDWDGYEIDMAPEEFWTEPTWVGVVQLKGARKTVVKRDGESVTIPTLPDVEYEEGNTVEVKDGHGVVEVISDEPLRSLNITVNKEVDVSRFRENDSPDRDTDERAIFKDFGGMEEVVERARDLIEVPLKYRDALTKIGARPIKGVLFTGPPGTGKTLLARIIAGEAESAFYPISGPAILTKWFGESEETLRNIFDAAAAEKKGAIIFFDEIDSVASARGSTSHEASRSVVAQLLTLMDGFKPNANVIVIAATNRPEDIDPALRRPGRFDWEIEFPRPDERDREKILRASSRKLSTDDDLPHAKVATDTRSWSAADLAAIWSEAALVAAKDGRERISDEDYFIGVEKVGAQRRRIKPPTRDSNA